MTGITHAFDSSAEKRSATPMQDILPAIGTARQKITPSLSAIF
jgi:hypothetical protein